MEAPHGHKTHSPRRDGTPTVGTQASAPKPERFRYLARRPPTCSPSVFTKCVVCLCSVSVFTKCVHQVCSPSVAAISPDLAPFFAKSVATKCVHQVWPPSVADIFLIHIVCSVSVLCVCGHPSDVALLNHHRGSTSLCRTASAATLPEHTWRPSVGFGPLPGQVAQAGRPTPENGSPSEARTEIPRASSNELDGEQAPAEPCYKTH